MRVAGRRQLMLQHVTHHIWSLLLRSGLTSLWQVAWMLGVTLTTFCLGGTRRICIGGTLDFVGCVDLVNLDVLVRQTLSTGLCIDF